MGKRLTNIESLPNDLVFKILVQFPPQDLQNGARLVCRRWYRIINSPDFTSANLQHSPPGLLIQFWGESRHSTFVAMQQGRITKYDFNYKFKFNIMGSCNGLVVDNNSKGVESGIYHVVNPTTEKRYALPPIPNKDGHYSCGVMAYVAASKEYKVVLRYSDSFRDVTGVECAILIVGVDMYWRHIDTEHLPITGSEFFTSSPLVAGGFIHWTESQSGNRVLTLNVETEGFTSTPVPQGYDKRCKYFLSTGSCLTMVVASSKLSWEVWELKQEESEEWMKMPEIDMEAQKGRIEELAPQCLLEPIGWLNYGEVLVLHASYTTREVCFAYNVRTREIDSFELNHNLCFSKIRFHRNSLVQLVF